MKVKVKKLHENAVIPSYAKAGDAGLDLTATSVEHKGDKIVYGTGLAFEIPEGYVGLIFPRSSIHKSNLRLSNSVGVIDSGYRGEVMSIFDCQAGAQREPFAVGERMAQILIMPYPSIELEEASELSSTERADGGFGSSGK